MRLVDIIQKTAAQIIAVVDLLGEYAEGEETNQASPIPTALAVDRAFVGA